MPMYYALLLVFPTVTCCVCQHSIKALLTYLLTYLKSVFSILKYYVICRHKSDKIINK